MENKEQFQEIAIRIGFDIYEEDGEFFYAETRMAYELFQAMKSQATPEGFVLVPYDVADRCMSHISIAMCHPSNSNSENDVMQMDLDILESAIEAQEQSHELD